MLARKRRLRSGGLAKGACAVGAARAGCPPSSRYRAPPVFPSRLRGAARSRGHGAERESPRKRAQRAGVQTPTSDSDPHRGPGPRPQPPPGIQTPDSTRTPASASTGDPDPDHLGTGDPGPSVRVLTAGLRPCKCSGRAWGPAWGLAEGGWPGTLACRGPCPKSVSFRIIMVTSDFLPAARRSLEVVPSPGD